MSVCSNCNQYELTKNDWFCRYCGDRREICPSCGGNLNTEECESCDQLRYGPCTECGELTPVSGEECQNCGYNDIEEMKSRSWKFVAGGIILGFLGALIIPQLFGIIGSFLSIPMILVGIIIAGLGAFELISPSQLGPVGESGLMKGEIEHTSKEYEKEIKEDAIDAVGAAAVAGASAIDTYAEYKKDKQDGDGSVEYIGYKPISDENDGPSSDQEPPTTSPSSPSSSAHSRGSFIFNTDDKDLIQKMEIRGNNGVTEVSHDVETKYLLTGPTFMKPTNIIQLDNPELYSEVTETSIRYNVTKIADYVAKLHESGRPPKLIVSIHTHPSGETYPSTEDKKDPTALKQELNRHFDDFEFMQGIHGLQERSVPDSTTLREAQGGEGHFWWYGENRRHEVAIFDEHFRPTPEVVVE